MCAEILGTSVLKPQQQPVQCSGKNGHEASPTPQSMAEDHTYAAECRVLLGIPH